MIPIGCLAYNSFFPLVVMHAQRRYCLKVNVEQPILVH